MSTFIGAIQGLEDHNAFECVGEIHETRLAFKKCYKKNVSGKAMDIFIAEVLEKTPSTYWQEIEEKYNLVDKNNHNIPKDLFLKLYDTVV